MSRQKPDRSKPEDTRLKRYTDIEKTSGGEGSSSAAKTVHERPATRSGARVREYARIERGGET